MIKFKTKWTSTAVLITSAVLATAPASAQKKYDTGASDTEIKIGNVEAYSGPASAYGVIGKTEEAYFKMINDAGGINGRKINFISYDDGYSPPKTVEQVRKLVESDEVFLIFNALGTPTQNADSSPTIATTPRNGSPNQSSDGISSLCSAGYSERSIMRHASR
jgi:ABC-type branched-subunit amino acid transport system substrate-binding protein